MTVIAIANVEAAQTQVTDSSDTPVAASRRAGRLRLFCVSAGIAGATGVHVDRMTVLLAVGEVQVTSAAAAAAAVLLPSN
eukprot:scaffold42664_cov49-Attheya_sp.AAC.2